MPRDELDAFDRLYLNHGLLDDLGRLGDDALRQGRRRRHDRELDDEPADVPADVRAEWARDHGIDGVDGAEWDADRRRDRERARRRAGRRSSRRRTRRSCAARRRWAGRRRRPGATRPTAATAGSCPFGCRAGDEAVRAPGAPRGGATRPGARIVERAPRDAGARRGRAGASASRRASRPDGDGSRPAEPLEPATRRLVVRAPQVVVAAGALRTPAVLLRRRASTTRRSGGICGSTRCRSSPGIFDEPIDMWRGTMQAARSLEFARPTTSTATATRSSRRPGHPGPDGVRAAVGGHRRPRRRSWSGAPRSRR